MKMIISGKNIDVTPGLRSAVEAKLGKLERYFTADTEIYVTLSVEKDRQKIEVTIPMKGNIIRSEQTSSDMYVSIDLVEEIIERQLRRYKTKLIAQQQAAASFQPDYLEADEEEEEEVKIVRTKKFDIKPMYPEDACVQMELLGHSFYVFCNAETDQVNVVYRRKGNTYGLIEPEVYIWIEPLTNLNQQTKTGRERKLPPGFAVRFTAMYVMPQGALRSTSAVARHPVLC